MKQNLFEALKGSPSRVYVVAEAAFNHGGSKERALTMVRAAKWSGADAIKFRTFRADKVTAPTGQGDRRNGSREALQKLELSYDVFRNLYAEAARLEIDFLSTPLDEESADFLEELGVSAFKIASGDITHRPLVEHVARKNKPILLSTGMSTADEVDKAIGWIAAQSNAQTILLHCVSTYPADPGDLNLKSVEYLRERFGVPVGFSDHTLGNLGATIAVSLGAQVIERHFTVETRGDIPEQTVAMDAKQLRNHIEELRIIARVMGRADKFATESENRHKVASRRALHAKRRIASGETIHSDMLYAVRPASGISPEFVDSVVGKQTAEAIEADAPIRWESLC